MYILNNIKRLSFFVAVLVFAGCGENFYSLTNKTLLDEMSTDLAYIQDNCQQVIINLEEKILTIPLSVDEKYMYVSSLLSCSGFDVRASLNMALGPPNQESTDPTVEKFGALDVMYAFINKDSFSLNEIKELTDIYSKALQQCVGRTNNNLRIICTLVGGASNTLALTKEFLYIFARADIPADQKALFDILKTLAAANSIGPDVYLLNRALDTYASMFNDDPDFESRLVRSAEAIQAGLSTLESLIGNSNGGEANLLIFMLDTVSDLILNSTGADMSTILTIMMLDIFGL